MTRIRFDTTALQNRLRHLGVPALWQWWLEQIRAIVPGPVLRLLGLQQGRLQCLPQADSGLELRLRRPGADDQALGQLPASADRGALEQMLGDQVRLDQAVEVLLPAARCFSRPITLPLATEDNLASVLRYEMDRQTPFSADQVYFAWDIIQRDAESQRLRVALVVVPRAAVDEPVAQLRALGLRVRAAYPEANPLPDASARWFNLLPRGQGGGGAFPGGRRARIAWVVTAAVLAVTLLLPLWQHRSLAIAYNQERQALAPEMARLSELQERREYLEEALEEPERLERARLSAVDLLAEVTERLPDGTYLTNLTFDNDELRIEGESESASQLIEALDDSDVFGNVRFLSSVQRGSDGRERFSIGGDVRPRPDEQEGDS